MGAAPDPAKLLERGVDDLVRISDARMSGTAFGTVVLHVAPESAVGRAAAARSQTAIPIVLDVDAGRLDVDVPAASSRAGLRPLRRAGPTTAAATAACTSSTSCRRTRAATSTSCATCPTRSPGASRYGLLSGWIGGW